MEKKRNHRAPVTAKNWLKRVPSHRRLRAEDIRKIKKIWPAGRSVKELTVLFGMSDRWVRSFAARHQMPLEKMYASGATWAIRRLSPIGLRGRCLTIPPHFCRRLNLEPGDQVWMETKGKSILLKKMAGK